MDPCLNGGSCLNDFVNNSIIGHCLCKLGFTGNLCQTRIQCPANFYTDDCSVECIATDNCQMHQACDYIGRLKCKDGWGNFPDCNTRFINPSIDIECPMIYDSSSKSNTPCLNGGSCHANGCCCPPGFTGNRCENAIHECYSPFCPNVSSLQSISPIIFNIEICIGFTKRNFDRILENLRISWQLEAYNSGMGKHNKMKIEYVDFLQILSDIR